MFALHHQGWAFKPMRFGSGIPNTCHGLVSLKSAHRSERCYQKRNVLFISQLCCKYAFGSSRCLLLWHALCAILVHEISSRALTELMIRTHLGSRYLISSLFAICFYTFCIMPTAIDRRPLLHVDVHLLHLLVKVGPVDTQPLQVPRWFLLEKLCYCLWLVCIFVYIGHAHDFARKMYRQIFDMNIVQYFILVCQHGFSQVFLKQLTFEENW